MSFQKPKSNWCALQVRGNTLQQVQKFKYFRVVFMSGERQNKKIDNMDWQNRYSFA